VRYFELKGRQRCFALDRYNSIDDNIHAVELTIMALRGVERWGGPEMMDAAFSGFQALPAPDGSPTIGRPPWYAVLGVDLNSTKEEIRRRYLELAKETHPDNGRQRHHLPNNQRSIRRRHKAVNQLDDIREVQGAA
jgi:hypothetical protein